MAYDSNRSEALWAAIEQWKATPGTTSASTIIKSAKEIESYLNYDDLKSQDPNQTDIPQIDLGEWPDPSGEGVWVYLDEEDLDNQNNDVYWKHCDQYRSNVVGNDEKFDDPLAYLDEDDFYEEDEDYDDLRYWLTQNGDGIISEEPSRPAEGSANIYVTLYGPHDAEAIAQLVDKLLKEKS